MEGCRTRPRTLADHFGWDQRRRGFVPPVQKKASQRLLVTCIASNWPLATVFFGARLGSQKSGNQIYV